MGGGSNAKTTADLAFDAGGSLIPPPNLPQYLAGVVEATAQLLIVKLTSAFDGQSCTSCELVLDVGGECRQIARALCSLLRIPAVVARRPRAHTDGRAPHRNPLASPQTGLSRRTAYWKAGDRVVVEGVENVQHVLTWLREMESQRQAYQGGAGAACTLCSKSSPSGRLCQYWQGCERLVADLQRGSV